MDREPGDPRSRSGLSPSARSRIKKDIPMAVRIKSSGVTLVASLRTVVSALDEAAAAQEKLIRQQARMQSIFAALLRIAKAGVGRAEGGAARRTRSAAARLATARLVNLEKSMQKESVAFSSVSNVLKTRHDTAKNAIGDIH